MTIKFLAAGGMLLALAGCGTTPENPVDYVTYRNEPLVKTVDKGMTPQQVLSIGGTPSAQMQRTFKAGACNNYVLNRDGHQQPYYVSFDATSHVDGQGFMTCEQMEANERAMK